MIGFIGGGNMAEALIKGFITHGQTSIYVTEIIESRRQYLASAYQIKIIENNHNLACRCPLIILAVKPQQIDTVLDEIAPAITVDKIIISIAAGITLEHLKQKLPTKNIVRAMPNTPALVQEGVTALSFDECFPEQERTTICNLFESVGTVIRLPEQQMNIISALSGSSPAFIALFLEAIIEAGSAMGISQEIATNAVLQTMIGTTALIKTGMPLQQLRTMVTSPGGSTLEGLKVFTEAGLSAIVKKALQATRDRADQLGLR